ncbi:hypothetical protein PBV87_09045 [Niameybacter massiliensis]|uniref:37-kD nucleoid-associated bacterial protein n=1 Tax=Holtiella tumoricola TaxID=3018743 RepID=A0AA42DMB9_9FIRM|nr:hypothetical protein [Holtiella tumoricola]MDA3731620.1 hypothetical protein [Holtiella tumoricola]
MNIIYSEFYNVDVKNQKIESKEIPDDFQQYISKLIESVTSNTRTRQYKTRSNTTEVINCINTMLLDVINNTHENFSRTHEFIISIVNRLLRCELEAQEQIKGTGNTVLVGSLIISLVEMDIEDKQSYMCIISKVDNNGFIDITDLKRRQGFSSEEFRIWRSTVISFEIEEDMLILDDIYVYLDRSVSYWCNTFLEIDEKINDEVNTDLAFKSVHTALARSLKTNAPTDYTILKNHLITYMRRDVLIDYDEMINSMLDEYVPYQVEADKLAKLKSNLLNLPASKGFEKQFNSIPKRIKSRMRSVYKVSQGITLKIDFNAENIDEMISSENGHDGHHYLKIRVEDEQTYRSFIRNRN